VSGGSPYSNPISTTFNPIFRQVEDLVGVLRNGQARLSPQSLSRLFETASSQLVREAVLIEIEPPRRGGEARLVIVGDLHGQLADLNLVFEKCGMPSEQNRYIFNGDFVDRGPFGLEILILVLSFKALYPRHVFLTRGNHEHAPSCVKNTFRNTWEDLEHRYSEAYGMATVAELATECVLPISTPLHAIYTPFTRHFNAILTPF